MTIDIRVPEAGESITQVELAAWLVEDGVWIEKDMEIAEIDSDKATLTINAEAAGKIRINVEAGTTVEPGKIIGTIDTDAEKPSAPVEKDKDQKSEELLGNQEEEKKDTVKENSENSETPASTPEQENTAVTFSPQAKRFLEENGYTANWGHINPDSKRITKRDILTAISALSAGGAQQATGKKTSGTLPLPGWGSTRDEKRQKMSTLRKKVAERLVAVKNQTAMLTTFNEVDMSAIISLRHKHQQAFLEKHGYKLGFMSFFVKAVTESIPFFPEVNGYIDDNHIVTPGYADVGIAVSTPKGLMVPVIRNAESKSIPQLETDINILAGKARNNKITIDELTGGTISITNGGVFGSMLSTPIINPPQSAILGMHNIIERPVAVNGKIEIRPMMYLALSYDHRIIDGKESVSFLVKVKEMIENPTRMLLQGNDPGLTILEL
jgi:2-oxoglutarate dehydrogenase E2 component (dihydrolipoamide succinyltransferase)